MSYTTLIGAAELAKFIDKPDWRIVDARFSLADSSAGAKAYRQGHIPGAVYVHLNDDLSSPVRDYSGRHPLPDFAQLAKKLGGLGIGNRTQVVVYDDAGGAFAGRLWWLLRVMGHSAVAVLDGGYPHWLKQGLPVTTTLPKPQPTDFRMYLDDRQWLDARQVEDGLARRQICLVDARTPERYAGLQEPIDPIAGHVPKALNRAFQRNLQADGRFRSPAELQQAFSALIAGYTPQQVVHMCGSGVTACHNLLAMEVAGLAGAKLYAGSWSEWIRNPNRSVATGSA